jgi:DNA-binding transcriptional LysR family regulator
MEIRQLRYFVAVAEELHFGRAATRCHIAQPPLSQQVRRLEEELGVKLLERTSRRVALTPEGAVFLREVRDTLDRLGQAVDRVQSMARGEEGTLRVGFIGPSALSRLPRAIRRFRENNPLVRLDFSARSTTEQLSLLLADRLDVAVVRVFGHDTQGLRQMLFLREPYVLALPEDHTLAAQERIHIAQLKGVPMIFNQRLAQPALYRSLMGAFHKAGFEPEVVQEVNTEQSTVALVSTGMGAALVPASSATDKRSGVVFRPLDGELPNWEITALWKGRRETPLLRRFLDVLAEFRSVPGEDAVP